MIWNQQLMILIIGYYVHLQQMLYCFIWHMIIYDAWALSKNDQKWEREGALAGVRDLTMEGMEEIDYVPSRQLHNMWMPRAISRILATLIWSSGPESANLEESRWVWEEGRSVGVAGSIKLKGTIHCQASFFKRIFYSVGALLCIIELCIHRRYDTHIMPCWSIDC